MSLWTLINTPSEQRRINPSHRRMEIHPIDRIAPPHLSGRHSENPPIGQYAGGNVQSPHVLQTSNQTVVHMGLPSNMYLTNLAGAAHRTQPVALARITAGSFTLLKNKDFRPRCRNKTRAGKNRANKFAGGVPRYMFSYSPPLHSTKHMQFLYAVSFGAARIW